MHSRLVHMRILSIELRLQRFGFAVFEGSGRFLDAGARRWRAGTVEDGSILVRKRALGLLRLYAPSVMVLSTVVRRYDERLTERRRFMDALQQEAERHGIEVATVGRDEMQRAFANLGGTTRHVIASRIASLFPELKWRLPPPRKVYESEQYSSAIFDAVAAGAAYLSRFGDAECLETSRRRAT